MNKVKLTIAGILVAIASWLLGGSTAPNLGGSIDYQPFAKMTTSSAVSVTTSDTLIQATTTRRYMVIVNDGAYPVYLALNGDAASVASEGIRLNATGGSYEMTPEDGNLYTGAIRAIAVGGTSVVTISVK